MTLPQDQAECIRDNYEYLGTFTPATGSAVSMRFEIERGITLQPTSYNTQAYARGIIIESLLADHPSSAEPNEGEKFTVDGQDYTISGIQDNDGRFVRAIVKET